MMYNKCAVNRAKLVDEAVVEMVLNHRYEKSGLRIMKSDMDADFSGVDLICYGNGTRKALNVKRNSSKYYNSPNFTMTLDKNKLNVFDNSSFIFIDEVANSLYWVDGVELLKYILEHSHKVQVSKSDASKSYLIIPKSDIILLVSDKPNGIIKYSKQIAQWLETGRNEEQFRDLF